LFLSDREKDSQPWIYLKQPDSIIIMKKNAFLSYVIIFLSAGHAFTADLTPQEVINRADRLFRGESSRSILSMKIIRPEWSRELSMKTWSKGDSFSLVLITSPARDKGCAFLKRGREMWNWVPSIARIVKIPPSMMNQSWMGSDFTNDDLVRGVSTVKDFTHRFLADTSLGDTALYRIEMAPKPDAPVVWDKIIEWVAKSAFIQRRVEYFDETGRMVSFMETKNIKNMGGRIIPTNLEMIPVDKKGQKTIMNFQSIEFNIPVNESFFSIQNMKTIR
jgi:hypothetical protein